MQCQNQETKPFFTALNVGRKARNGQSALIILGFNKEAATLTLQQPEGQWDRRLDNQDPQFGGSGEHLAPERLSLSKSEKVNLTIPPYPAWVYLSESVGGAHPTKL